MSTVRLLGSILHITIQSNQNHLDTTVTEALERNPQITNLYLILFGSTSLRTWPRLLHHLETRNNLQKIKLSFVGVRPVSSANIASLLQSLQRNTNIQSFGIHGTCGVPIGSLVSFLNAASTRLSAVAVCCTIENSDSNNDGPALLAASLKRLTNLQSLELFNYSVQVEYVVAIYESLGRTQSVQTLEINLRRANQFKALTSLTRLMRSTSTIRELVIDYAAENSKQTLLTIAKTNFSLRGIRLGRGSTIQFSVQEQRLLDFYANRNGQMDQWMENPASVPQHLWCNALNVAVQAENPSALFRSLLATSGALAPAKRTRKRKRPDYYKPT